MFYTVVWAIDTQPLDHNVVCNSIRNAKASWSFATPHVEFAYAPAEIYEIDECLFRSITFKSGRLPAVARDLASTHN